ncbi:MAG: metal-dependent hydrolase [Calditrichaeota bacterium]|nr:metal-dependent hydrolase [Calditrichota bacterium]
MPKLTFLGHAAFLIEGDKGRLIIDPFLEGNPKATLKPTDVQVDYVLLTHGHGDHLGDAIAIAKANNATVIAPFELATYCQNQGVEKVHPMHIGGGYDFPFGRVKLTIAHHGSMTPDGTYAGNPCGFLITMDGKTIYHAGDTGLFYDMKLIGEMHKIDVALLPIGDNFTMGVEDAVKATEFLQPRLVVPMHYQTFDVIAVEPEQFVKQVTSKGFNAKVVPPGESFEI